MHHLSLQSNDSKSCLLLHWLHLSTGTHPIEHKNLVFTLPKKEAQQTYEEQLPHSLNECVSERFFCPAVPSAWLNCMQGGVCGSNFKPL